MFITKKQFKELVNKVDKLLDDVYNIKREVNDVKRRIDIMDKIIQEYFGTRASMTVGGWSISGDEIVGKFEVLLDYLGIKFEQNRKPIICKKKENKKLS